MERIEHLPYFDHQTGRFRYIRIALEGDGLSLGMLQKFLHCFLFLWCARWGRSYHSCILLRDTMIGGGGAELIFMASAGSFIIYGLIAINISRKFMPFIYMAEGIFEVLGWERVERIDLPKKSRAARRTEGMPGLGKLYFKY